MRRRDVRPPSDWNFPNKKPAADFSAPGSVNSRDDVDVPLICPTCQILFWLVNQSRKIRERRCDKPRLTTRREPAEFWSSRLSLLGGEQKLEQPAGRRRIRIVGVEARKCRDPARKAAHRN